MNGVMEIRIVHQVHKVHQVVDLTKEKTQEVVIGVIVVHKTNVYQVEHVLNMVGVMELITVFQLIYVQFKNSHKQFVLQIMNVEDGELVIMDVVREIMDVVGD